MDWKALYPKKWAEWAYNVRKRDGYKCQLLKPNGKKCGYKSKTNKPHHIYPKAEFPLKVFDVNNGITLCQNCHIHIVHKNGYEMYISQFIQTVAKNAVV